MGFGTSAEAACLLGRCSQNGLIFSPASSDFTITNVTGNGTLEDPFVIYQDVLGLDISLAIDKLGVSTHLSIFNRPGFALRVVSRNLTGAFWRFYDHELQETAGFASGENDGLSFAQGIDAVRPYISSHYDQTDEVTDVRDFINFHQGRGVDLGETVQFDYVITDTIPNQQFYIRQRPDYRPEATPAKSSQQAPSTATSQSGKTQRLEPITRKLTSEKSKVPQPIPEPSNLTIGTLAFLLIKSRRTHR